MNRRSLVHLGGLAMMLALGACARGAGTVTPTLNPDRVPFPGQAGIVQRGNQIRRAGTGLGWIMEERGVGLTRATFNARSQQAVVDIIYDTTTFSIRYAGSTNLGQEGGNIGRAYNAWVERLQRAILTAPPG